MPFNLKPLANVIRVEPSGGVYAGQTRMPFAQLIGDYTRGNTIETIAAMYPGLPLADLFGAIAYYLQHREECDRFAREECEHAERLYAEWLAKPDPKRDALRERLLRAMEQKRQAVAVPMSEAHAGGNTAQNPLQALGHDSLAVGS